jgi:hypothetical protein
MHDHVGSSEIYEFSARNENSLLQFADISLLNALGRSKSRKLQIVASDKSGQQEAI